MTRLRSCSRCGGVHPAGTRGCPDSPRTGTWGARDTAAHNVFAKAVKQRAGGRCERCGAIGVPFTHNSTGLVAHHTQPGNNDPSTGLGLCPRCHRELDPHARDDTWPKDVDDGTGDWSRFRPT